MTNIEYYENTPISKILAIYTKEKKDNRINKNTIFTDWLNMEHKKTKIVYYWDCRCDGSRCDESLNSFHTQEDCYNDMLNAVSKKIIWNVEWEDVTDMCCLVENKGCISGCCGDGIMHKTEYLPNKIIDHSYSGEYVWEIKTKEVV